MAINNYAARVNVLDFRIYFPATVTLSGPFGSEDNLTGLLKQLVELDSFRGCYFPNHRQLQLFQRISSPVRLFLA